MDKLDHYLECQVLWFVVHEAFEGDISPCIVSRIGYDHPSLQNLIMIHLACLINQALKIGFNKV